MGRLAARIELDAQRLERTEFALAVDETDHERQKPMDARPAAHEEQRSENRHRPGQHRTVRSGRHF